MTTLSGRSTPKRRGAVRLSTVRMQYSSWPISTVLSALPTPIIAAKSRMPSAG